MIVAQQGKKQVLIIKKKKQKNQKLFNRTKVIVAIQHYNTVILYVSMYICIYIQIYVCVCIYKHHNAIHMLSIDKDLLCCSNALDNFK